MEAYHEHFALDNVPDGEWLRFVGARGWVALSHNKRIRYEPDELDDLMASGVKAFFIIGKGPHPAFAAAILGSIERIKRLILQQPEPFIAKVYQGQHDVALWVTYRQWLKARRHPRT